MKDHYNAFVDEEVIVNPLASGTLSGLTFAVKDVFPIKGVTASAGNPDWLKTHSPAATTAEVIQTLLHAGATLQGTTITDEIMYSLNGENAHYGTPVNPKANARIPGGSSSGSAVAVAADMVDFAIGTDTGGSVRIPAAYCGLYGIRPTHGRISIEGVIPLAKSFDTVGWMAKEAKLLLDVGESLTGELVSSLDDNPFTEILFGDDTWELADGESKKVLLSMVRQVEEEFDSKWTTVATEGLARWASCFRTLQGLEIWEAHGKWIKEVKPSFGPDIAARFEWASSLKQEDRPNEQKLREMIQTRMADLLGEDKLLIIPTTPGKAPLRNLSGAEIEKRRSETMQLSCIAGLAGLPQVAIPIEGEDGIPISISVIAGPNQDMRLLQWVYENRNRFM
ncbi:amidase [Halalkalibacter wakoensis JCM 9140]|uniref:Amidase n=1 Tax=Halalkalibacter wakoensis JCM 9140 TaxID=1236970 RepID=W4Q414_9BACI|nr:amidase [Halalkalibacter wakoensis]GAE26104.1 amidase [Halalkalibacter wakoensis JCM 9140]